MDVSNVGTPSLKTASGVVKAAPGDLLGFYVNSTTAGTLILHDHASAASNAVTGTITPAVGWHPLPLKMSTGIYAEIGGTLNVTLVYR